MNKLVSKNPVLRFKEERKIIKAQFGYKVRKDGVVTNSYGVPIGHTSNPIYSYLLEEQPKLSETVENNSSDLSFLNNDLNLRLLLTVSEIEDRPNTKGKTVPVTRNVSRRANNSPFNFGGIQKNWRGVKGSLDANVLEQLRKTGFKGKTALEAQQYLNNNFANVGLFGSKISIDNAWGSLSLKGFDAFMKAWNKLQALQSKQQVSLTQTPEFLEELRLLFIKEETPLQQIERAIVNNNNLLFKRNGNYNRSGIRDLIRQYGLNAYNFTGDLRKALRLYLNGQSNDTSLLTNGLERFIVPYKKGGLLPSRNPVLRFKSNFR